MAIGRSAIEKHAAVEVERTASGISAGVFRAAEGGGGGAGTGRRARIRGGANTAGAASGICRINAPHALRVIPRSTLLTCLTKGTAEDGALDTQTPRSL